MRVSKNQIINRSFLNAVLLSAGCIFVAPFSFSDEASNAIDEILNDGYRTSDLMSNETTKQVGCYQMDELLAEKLK